MNDFKLNAFTKPVNRLVDWAIAGGLGGIALLMFFLLMADYAFPGESAHLMTIWQGLTTTHSSAYPLLKFFAVLLGSGNLIAPITGAVVVVLIYHLTSFFIRERIATDELYGKYAPFASRFAGIVAAVITMLTPAVREAATHLEPRLFDAMWALLALSCLVPFARASKKTAWCFSFLMGALAGAGLVDSALTLALAPLYLWELAAFAIKSGRKSYTHLAIFLAAFFLAFLTLGLMPFTGDFIDIFTTLKTGMMDYWKSENFLFILIFATVPFVAVFFSAWRAFNEQSTWAQWLFHLTMTFVTLLGIVTFSPSELMRPFGILPVASSLFVAFTAGYVLTYWVLQTKEILRSDDEEYDHTLARIGRVIGSIALGVFLVAAVISQIVSLCFFDSDRGAFADVLAERVLKDMGARQWIVTDGELDDHLLLAIAKAKKDVHLVSLTRYDDKDYINELRTLITETGVCGPATEDAKTALSIGLVPFLQDWISKDPEVTEKLVVLGSPEIWYSSGKPAVPEFLFFGASTNFVADWSEWDKFDKILKAPKNWGSYTISKEKDPTVIKRYRLRRHMGLMCTDYGYWLQDQKRDDEAFEAYERVLKNIDVDNISALFNEYEMVRGGLKQAQPRRRDIEKTLQNIVADKSRRYVNYKLGSYYGYIRNPIIFARLSLDWARSGCPSVALQQMSRAIDLMPNEQRIGIMNMMASYYQSDNNEQRSREIYEDILKNEPDNHDALIGMMCIELSNHQNDKAEEYLRRAVESLGDDPRATIERAMLSLIRGDLPTAKKDLQQITDHNPSDLRAWSLIASISMQEYDMESDPKAKKEILHNLETVVLPAMEKQAAGPSDYYYQTTRAFLLMRKGSDKRAAARDALAAASMGRPSNTTTRDMVMSLDIELNDPTNAEFHAREVLKRNRKAPLANYIMGSLRLKEGNLSEAATFLRIAAEAPNPSPLALNDMAEVLRRTKNLKDAEIYARKCIAVAPKFYVPYDTLGTILLEKGENLDEAEKVVSQALELSRDANGREQDVRIYMTLARIQIAKKDMIHARASLKKVQQHKDELTDYERNDLEELKKRANGNK